MEKKDLKFVFFGTPDVASLTLEILKQNGYLPELIVTAPDRPQGRKMIITPPPVKTWAIENNIPYIQPEDIRGLGASPHVRHVGNHMSDMWENNIKPDLFIVVAYGKILPEELIKLPKYGSINIHYSLLPKYRGASPVESAILNGDKETGITIQQMEYKMDAGPIIATEVVSINEDEKAPDLRKRLIEIGGELLVKTLPDFVEGKIKQIPQDETKATHCRKIKKEDGLIDLNDAAQKNYDKFRAYAHWPRTYFFRDNKRIIITDAKIENGTFVIKKVIPEGGKETNYIN